LENGLRYVIFPNKTPPNRFEAHLEVHAGSVDERADQQVTNFEITHFTYLENTGFRVWLIWLNM